jgi:2-furoyl-CoA dehydrogenase large subunit
VAANKLRHKVPRDSGGSFGVKQAVLPYVVLMCLASKQGRRRAGEVGGGPARTPGRGHLGHRAADAHRSRRRRPTAASPRCAGTSATTSAPTCVRRSRPRFYRMHGALSGAYDIQHLAVRNRVVVTNKTPTGLVRGFGGPQVYYALERLMDRIAVELGIDPLALRQRNFVRPRSSPTRGRGRRARFRRLPSPGRKWRGRCAT